MCFFLLDEFLDLVRDQDANRTSDSKNYTEHSHEIRNKNHFRCVVDKFICSCNDEEQSYHRRNAFGSGKVKGVHAKDDADEEDDSNESCISQDIYHGVT